MAKDIDKVINTLLKTNDSIATLINDITENSDLNTLIQKIFEGKKIPYHLKKEFSSKGAGCIVEDNDEYCSI